MDREDDGPVDGHRGKPGSQASRIVDVLGAMQGEQDVARVIRGHPWQVILGALRGPGMRVDHHVADQRGAALQALVAKVLQGGGGGGQEEVGQVVGDDAVALLRHGAVEGAQAGLHVRQPRATAVREGDLGHDHRRREGRVRVAVDDDAVRGPLGEDRLQAPEHLRGLRRMRPGTHAQVHVRLGNLQVAEERGAHGVVVVLAGVDQHLGVRLAQETADRCRLHELRARAHDGQNAHAVRTRRPAGRAGRSAGRDLRRGCRRPRREAAHRRHRRCRAGAPGSPPRARGPRRRG